MKKRNKLLRISKVLSLGFSILLKIYSYKILRKPEADWEKLWQQIGRRFKETLFALEGLLIKIGQILSTRSDLLPEAFTRELEDLTDHVPPSDWREIERILQKEWGPAYQEHFLLIEKKAVASASIGEVYQGVLRDGRKTAIKVKRPQIEEIVKTDFHILKIIFLFFSHFIPLPKGFMNFKVLYQEVRAVIERELDYTQELHTMQMFRERFKDMESVKIPAVYPELSTRNVLVMEWVEGERLTQLKDFEHVTIEEKETAQKLLEVFLPQWLEPGIFHADPHPGNLLLADDGKIILLDFGMIGVISNQDAVYFQRLVESFLAKNAAKAVDCLFHLGFILPSADTKMIEKMLKELMNMQLLQAKDFDLIALQKDMNQLLRALPVQVPTRFVFLGRSIAAVEGIILQLVPEEDLAELSKPVFLKWMNKKGNHKWFLLLQWFQAQPIYKIFHFVSELLKTPQKIEALKEIEQRRHFQFTIFENHKKYSFQIMLLGFIGSGTGLYLSHEPLLYAGGGGIVIGFISFCIISFRQRKWLKQMHEYRRQ